MEALAVSVWRGLELDDHVEKRSAVQLSSKGDGDEVVFAVEGVGLQDRRHADPWLLAEAADATVEESVLVEFFEFFGVYEVVREVPRDRLC